MRKFLLLISDIFALYAALWLTLFVRYNFNFREQISFHLVPFSILFLAFLFIFYISNLYEVSSLRNGQDFYGTFLRVMVANTFAGIVYFYLLPFWKIAPRRNLFLFLVFFSILDFGLRLLFNKTVSSKKFRKPTIIVGLNSQSLQLAGFLKKNPQLGYQLEGIFDISEGLREGWPSDLGVIRNVNQFKNEVETKHVNTVIISPEAYKLQRMTETFYQLIRRKINFYPLGNFYEKISQRVLLDDITQIWFLENLSEGSKKLYEVGKKLSDLVFAAVFGIAALILTPLIALAIKLNSPGTVFFRQTRVGQLGKHFKIIKFRTMAADSKDGSAEGGTGAVWAQEDDPRITGVGKFLRRTRLDELPQLWNVLKGEMSLVGPRAERPEFHGELEKSLPFYEERYLIKPGLTGWAQIKYRYGSSVKDAAEKLQYDLFYIKHRSLVLDLSIVLKTLNIVIRQAGR
ncbi:MAG: sugar transferase [Candidatus Yanofskybacteria bacterium]|nr:sugar transferase [Candidatus Yanofskybacteria bacterium]